MSRYCARKETVFEGYYTAYWGEGSYLEKEREYTRRGKMCDRLQELFREYLGANLKKSDQFDFIGLDEIIPKQVYKALLKNPNQRFRFKFVVEVEEV